MPATLSSLDAIANQAFAKGRELQALIEAKRKRENPMVIPKVCENAARLVTQPLCVVCGVHGVPINAEDQKKLIQEHAEIIAKQTHFAEVMEVLKFDRDDGMDGDLLTVIAETLCEAADNVGTSECFTAEHLRKLASRVEQKQAAITAVLDKLEGK